MAINNLLIIDDKSIDYEINQNKMLNHYKTLVCYLNRLSNGDISPDNLYIFQVELQDDHVGQHNENNFQDLAEETFQIGESGVQISFCNARYDLAEAEHENGIADIRGTIDALNMTRDETLILLDAKLMDIESKEGNYIAKRAINFSKSLYCNLTEAPDPYKVIYYSAFSHTLKMYALEEGEDMDIYTSMADISWYDVRTTARRIWGAYKTLYTNDDGE